MDQKDNLTLETIEIDRRWWPVHNNEDIVELIFLSPT